MKKTVILIIILFSVLDKPLSQETQVQQSASAYAFLIDSVIIKEFRQSPQLKDHRIVVCPISKLHPSDEDLSSIWKELKLYYANVTGIRFLDRLVNNSNSFHLKKVAHFTTNAGNISMPDSATCNSYEELSRLSGLKNTSVVHVSNVVLTNDRPHCIMFIISSKKEEQQFY